MSTTERGLPSELLRHILDELEPNPDEPVPVDRRRFLSQESLDRPSPPPRSCIEDIASFRLACKQFANVGAPLLFTRVVTRLSKRDLKRLDTLAGWQVAEHVKRFSYLVPYFFQNRDRRETLPLPRPANSSTQINLGSLQRKADERDQILRDEHDARVLKKAIGAFKSLQHVRILPVADEEQQKLLRLIRQEPTLTNFVELDWTQACYHCSRTVGTALREANRRDIRFSYPKLSPHDARYFYNNRMRSISNVAATLTSLTLQFEEVNDMDSEVQRLADLFRTVFSKAENMEAIHVGFLSPQPLDLHLEDVFQNVTWSKLVAFGIHGWNLHAEEILNLAIRHRRKLKGLRLRKAYLRDGSMWRDVLSSLKEAMSSLEWISLTGIGYVHSTPVGVEEPEELPATDDSSDESETENSEYFNRNHVNGNDDPIAGPSNHHHHETDRFEDDEFYGDTDSEEEPRGDVNEIEFLDLHGTDLPRGSPKCNCDDLSNVDVGGSLDDDGVSVSWSQAKTWERWVVNRCPVHGKR